MKQRLSRGVALMVLLGLLVGCQGGGDSADLPDDAGGASVVTPEPLQATIVDLVNDVDAHPLPDGDWQDAEADMVVHEGGEVWAKEASTARVAVEEGLVRVAPNTVFSLGRPEADTMELTLDEGQVWVNVEGLEEGEVFQIRTPSAVASVRGTRVSVRVEADGTVIVSSHASSVTVQAAEEAVVVWAGQQTTVAPEGPPAAPETISLEEAARWGWAQGSDLSAVLPVAGPLTAFSIPEDARDLQLNYDGSILSYALYGSGDSIPYYGFVDTLSGVPISVTLPLAAEGLAFSPLDDRLVFSGGNKEICTTRGDGSELSCFFDDRLHLFRPDVYWFPDGDWLLYVSGRNGINLAKVRTDGSELTQLTSTESGIYENVAVSPDGDWIAYVYKAAGSEMAELWVMRADGTEGQLLYQTIYPGATIAWNPSGNEVAASEYGNDGCVRVFPIDGSESWRVPDTEGWRCWNPVWSPTDDGYPLFFLGDPPGDPQQAPSGHGQESAGPTQYPPEGATGVYYVMGAGQTPLPFAGPGIPFSANGVYVSVRRGSVIVYRLAFPTQ